MVHPYKQTTINGRNGYVHRKVMQQALGRPHKNGDKHDNRLENLEVVDRAEHSREHHPLEYPKERACPWCGERFSPPYGNRNRQVCCSKPCALRLRWAVRRGERTPPEKPKKTL